MTICMSPSMIPETRIEDHTWQGRIGVTGRESPSMIQENKDRNIAATLLHHSTDTSPSMIQESRDRNKTGLVQRGSRQDRSPSMIQENKDRNVRRSGRFDLQPRPVAQHEHPGEQGSKRRPSRKVSRFPRWWKSPSMIRRTEGNGSYSCRR